MMQTENSKQLLRNARSGLLIVAAALATIALQGCSMMKPRICNQMKTIFEEGVTNLDKADHAEGCTVIYQKVKKDIDPLLEDFLKIMEGDRGDGKDAGYNFGDHLDICYLDNGGYANRQQYDWHFENFQYKIKTMQRSEYSSAKGTAKRETLPNAPVASEDKVPQTANAPGDTAAGGQGSQIQLTQVSQHDPHEHKPHAHSEHASHHLHVDALGDTSGHSRSIDDDNHALHLDHEAAIHRHAIPPTY